MILEGTSLIGWQRGNVTTSTLAAVNPGTDDTLEPPFYPATTADVDTAARLAAEAFIIYRKWDGKRRGKLLRHIAEKLAANEAAIVERAQLETALSPARLQGELARTGGQLRLSAGLIEEGSWVDARIDHGNPARQPLPKPDVRSCLIPLGPVVVFSASNFPLAYSVAGGDTASALAAGCPVIVKAHEAHPGTSEIVGMLVREAVREAVRESGAPEGVFSMLQGLGKDVGVALVKHPAVQAVGFTGSRGAGRALMDEAAEWFKNDLATRMKQTTPGTMLTAGIRASYERVPAESEAVEGVQVLARVPGRRCWARMHGRSCVGRSCWPRYSVRSRCWWSVRRARKCWRRRGSWTGN